MNKLAALAIAACLAAVPTASAKERTMAYLIGPKYQMNKALFIPFAERLAKASG